MHNDKSRDGHDDELPCWQRHCDDESVHRYSVRIIDQCDVTIASGSHIDDVTIAKLLTFENISGAARNEWYDFCLSKTTWAEDSITNEQWYFAMLNITRGWIKVRDDRFSKSAIERICGVLDHLVSDVMINWHAQRARRNMPLISSALPNILCVMTVMACRWIVGIVKI